MAHIAFFGASGTLGRATLSTLLSRKKQFSFSLLLLPADWNKKEIKALARRFGLKLRPPRVATSEFRIDEVPGLRVVWGYAKNAAAVKAVVAGADWVLNAMALISPAADSQPKLAREVNDEAVQTIIDAICEEPNGAERIGHIHTGSVAQTGNRPPGFHLGRVGDPMNPSLFDHYAITKIGGERRVMESELEKWVSLRMSFIMPTNHSELIGLFDPIMFHMPPDTRMESVSDRDAGYALAQCIEQPLESDFWRKVYNIGGGPGMRSVAIEYLNDIFSQLGLDWKRCSDRNWYALQNFHLQFYSDSQAANDYLYFWRDDLESFREALTHSMKWYFRLFYWLNTRFTPFRAFSHAVTHRMLRGLASNNSNSPRHWYLHDKHDRLQAFFGSREAYENIGDWDSPPINIGHRYPAKEFEHGFIEGKSLYSAEEVSSAADYRGGHRDVPTATVDAFAPLHWTCAFGHHFTLKLHTVFHGGHWCPECIREWNGAKRAEVDRFFAQAWYASLVHASSNFKEGR